MKNKKAKALRWAFPHTLPVLAGFSVLGIAYGVLMCSHGFSPWLAILISAVVFAGSMQFVLVNLLIGAFNPVQAFLMTLMINARHLFYGVSMIDRYKGMGAKKPYLIFALCDETFSINCSADVPDDVDKSLAMMWVSILNQFYWVMGTTLGAVFGSFIKFNTEGIDFCMTAMFVVILLEKLLDRGGRTSGIMGLAISVACLMIFGADYFIIPSMVLILVSICVMQNLKKGGAQND